MLNPFWTQFKPHPFRRLLSLEWLLLGTIAVTIPIEVLGFSNLSSLLWSNDDAVNTSIKTGCLLLTFLLFGLIGLRLPTTRKSKILYHLLEFGLFGFACYLQSWNSSRLIPLLVIVMMRACLVLETRGRWWMLGMTSGAYMLAQLPGGLFVVAFVLFGLSPDQLASAQGNWGKDWGQIFPDGRVVVHVNTQFQPEQVKIFLSGMRSLFIQFYVTEFITFTLMILFVILLVNALISERQGRRNLAIAHEQLYQYSRQIEDQSILQERARIARDLHDSLGHLLTAQNIQLQNAQLHLTQNPESAQTFLTSSTQFGTQALSELRNTLTQLRTPLLEGRSLQQALQDLLDQLAQLCPIDSTVEYILTTPLSPPIQTALYRITEEALMNSYKHSQAKTLQIQVNEADRQVHLTIVDDGQGFDLQQLPTGFGLRGMRERSEGLGGTLEVQTKPGFGCRILVRIPLPLETTL
jgi:signal transduction histidine kinase